MKLDIKKALQSPFRDEKWKSKLFILTFLITINLLFNTLNIRVLQFLISCIIIGYCLQYAHNEIHDINPILPDWFSNFFKYFNYGASSILVCLVYVLLYSIPIYIVFYLIKSSVIANVFLAFITLVIIFWGLSIYCDNFKFKKIFNIFNFLKLIYKAKWELFIIIFLFMIFVVILYLIESYFQQKHIINIVYILITPLYSLATTNLIAQLYKKVKH